MALRNRLLARHAALRYSVIQIGGKCRSNIPRLEFAVFPADYVQLIIRIVKVNAMGVKVNIEWGPAALSLRAH